MLVVADMDALNSIGGVRTEGQTKLFVRKVPQRRNYRDGNIGSTGVNASRISLRIVFT
jgi:hypothetical protein